MDSIWDSLRLVHEINTFSFLTGLDIIKHTSLVSKHFYQVSTSNILWWNICKISKKIDQNAYHSCIQYETWKQFYISNPCIGHDCSSISKGISRVGNNQTIFFSPGIYDCSHSNIEFNIHSKKVYNIIGVGADSSDVMIIKSKYNYNTMNTCPSIINISHSNKSMKCMIKNVKLRLCLDNNAYRYYNPSTAANESFDYSTNPFHINYEINVFNKYYGPSCIRITFDNPDTKQFYEHKSNDVNIEDININDMNIIIENCIIESPQGFGIETGVDITGKSEFFQPFSELNFSSCRKPNYSNRNIMIKNNNICYSRWSGIHIGCVAMSYILNNNIYKNKINGIWTTTYAAPMIEYNNLYDNGWEALCCNNLGGAYFKNNELNNNGLCLDFNIENNGSYSLWNNHDNEHTKVEL
eukprot:478321_1